MTGCGHVWLPNDKGGVELSGAWCGPCVRELQATIRGMPSQLSDAIERAGRLALMLGTAQRAARRWKALARLWRGRSQRLEMVVTGGSRLTWKRCKECHAYRTAHKISCSIRNRDDPAFG